MRVNLRDILADAKQKKYAIFATNAFNFDSAEIIIDALAIAVGTVHGVFTSKPDIDFGRITNIRKQIETPLVLHGCSGLSDDDFKKAIQNGITKLNYYTDLVLEAARKAKEIINGEGETNYLELNRNIMIAIKNMIMRKMDVFGSSGKG